MNASCNVRQSKKPLPGSGKAINPSNFWVHFILKWLFLWQEVCRNLVMGRVSPFFYDSNALSACKVSKS